MTSNNVTHFASKPGSFVPLVFRGMQELCGFKMALYDIKKPVVGPVYTHPVNSTLTDTTLTEYGYTIR